MAIKIGERVLKSKLDKPAVARKIVKLLADGEKNTSICKKVGCDITTLYRWRKRDDVREWIEEQGKKYLNSLPDALALSKNVIDIGKKQTDGAISRDDSGSVVSVNTKFIDQKILDLALKEVETLRKAVGITPSNTSSVVIGQLVMGDNQNILAPNVQGILDRQLAQTIEAEVIEDAVESEVIEEQEVIEDGN